jgi:hypothetical protein
VEVRVLPCAPARRLNSCTNCSRCRARLLRLKKRTELIPLPDRSALVAQRTERRASTSGLCGFESCRGLQQSQRQCVHVAQWTRAEASEASGCAFESRRGLNFENCRAIDKRRVGRAARHRGANAARPSGRAGSTPALSAILPRPARLDRKDDPRPVGGGGGGRGSLRVGNTLRYKL